ncbi:MAG: cytochrome c4 [Gammaproteobacteria bacterium]|nr:cytochrome c4 [Gammaproteobacteria bacterium]
MSNYATDAHNKTAVAEIKGDALAGEKKAQVCLACHGVNGNSMNPEWPSLAGQHHDYLVKQLKIWRAGDRQDPLMSAQAVHLSDKDIEDLSAYFSQQTIKAGKADPEQLALGKKIYRAGNAASGVSACTACHGPTGRGNPAANMPAIGGQMSNYVARQLRAYAAGERGHDSEAAMMNSIARKMTTAEIDAVANYVQGLQARPE